MSHIVEAMTDFLLCQNVICEEDKEVYNYSIDILLSLVLDTVLILVIGIVMKHFSVSVVFALLFPILRKHTGGYHAKTKLQCRIVSTVLVFIAISIVTFMQDISGILKIVYLGVVVSFYLIITYFFVPIENNFKPLDETNRRHNKKVSVIYGILIFLVELIMLFYNSEVFLSLVTVQLEVTGLIIVSLLKRRGERHEKEYS